MDERLTRRGLGEMIVKASTAIGTVAVLGRAGADRVGPAVQKALSPAAKEFLLKFGINPATAKPMVEIERIMNDPGTKLAEEIFDSLKKS